MRHFALTHSLTLLGDPVSDTKVTLLAKKQDKGAPLCYWLRSDAAGFAECIAIGRALLSETINVAVVSAESHIEDRVAADRVAQALSEAGLHHFQLLAHAEAISLSGAA